MSQLRSRRWAERSPENFAQVELPAETFTI